MINLKVFEIINCKDIEKKLGNQLIVKNSKLGSLRLLAKLHKKELGFRPIINSLKHPTSLICLLLDIILQPFVKNNDSYSEGSWKKKRVKSSKKH